MQALELKAFDVPIAQNAKVTGIKIPSTALPGCSGYFLN
jgi:hypothetical protein